MSSTLPTKHDFYNAKEDLMTVDAVSNSKDPVSGTPISSYQTRRGGQTDTIQGRLDKLGLIVVGDTVTGCVLTSANQVVLNNTVGSAGAGNYYSWTGTFPKTVSPNTDPALTSSGYIPRSDILLRQQLSAKSGSEMIGHSLSPLHAAVTVAIKLREHLSVKDFGAVGNGVVDDTIAVQAAVDYACANNRCLYFPTGIYRVTKAITVHVPTSGDGSIILRGEGVRSVIKQEGIGEVGLIFSKFNFILHGHIRDLTVECSAQSSHGIVIGSGLGDCSFISVDVKVANLNASCWYGDFRANDNTGLGIYMTQWRGGTWKLAEGSNAHGFHILTRGSYFNQNTISDVVPYFATGKQFFCFESTGDRIVGNEFRNITLEVCPGGGFLWDTMYECHFNNIVFYDVLGQNQYTNDLFRCTKGTSAARSSNCTFTGLSRVGGAMAAGRYDFFADNLVYSTFSECVPLYGGGLKIHLADLPNTICGLTTSQLAGSTGLLNITHISYESGIRFPGSTMYFAYSSGTWTARLTGYGSGPTTPITATGTYSINGDVLTATVSFSGVNTTGASGQIAIAGLPKKANNQSIQVGSAAQSGMSATAIIAPTIAAGADQILLSDAATLAPAVFSPGANKRLVVSISYIIQ